MIAERFQNTNAYLWTDQHAIDRLSIDQSVDHHRGTFRDDCLARRRTSAARSTVAKFVTT
ncbi:hypothetical protein DBV15_01091 [Temnothorax longispinosus]|uniref:Uncharacterized protein n=1 Tax=Temnothorax longispinosus TaxID=300112 RepID=A0A4S2J9V3_9HYME|nr:hypothetical protein DBV15_01091 [Temnothorax longispinosus]